MQPRDRLIVALDVQDEKECFDLIETLSPAVDVFKVGIAPFTEYGQKILAKIEEYGKKVFLDLKFHDIPNTVKNAAYAAAKKNIFMMNFHCIGGIEMMKSAVEGAKQAQKEANTQGPILLGVTVLTSMDQDTLEEIGIIKKVDEQVVAMALLAKEAGMNGVVASAQETKLIKEKAGKEFIVVTPGIRPGGADVQDQKRVVTPKEAIENGSDYIVVGRPIIHNSNPLGAAKKVLEEMR